MSATATPESTTRERLSPHERLELLCDNGTFEPIRSGVVSPKLGPRARPGDGVVGGLGRVDGRPVACYAQDVSFLGGSLGAAHADTINRVLQLAGRSRVPVVGFIESGGARMQEGTAALGGYGRIFRHNVALSGVVPQISIIGGLSAGGGCYSPALTDFVVMTQDAAMFLTGPGVVKEVMGEDVSAAELGGHKIHDRNGVCDLVVPDDRAAARLSRTLLSYLPQHSEAGLPRTLAVEPELAEAGAAVPDDPRKVYDVRDAIMGIVDGGSLLEIQPRWARNIVTAFARIDGRPVGVIANQPRFLGGVLDAESSQKGARFVETCNAYGVPLVVLVDTPGFMPGTRQEQAGVIRFGATLVRAFAAATVPRVTVVLRKAYGGAFITMNSKDLGADLVLAWPNAEIGVMGAQPAVGIIHRRELAAAEDPVGARAALAAAYAEEHLGAAVAAANGFVDEVIEPHETRRRLAWALSTMDDRRAGAFLA
ncbi:MAG TPA: acyl-CoA carboxylase subunit beta [Conexibacter sp.]|jgi:acetyl-CoA carboxylase carboxyltransferase component|nr:acyl-CoA carboxylase subunit beta [Conexibacter sp.]